MNNWVLLQPGQQPPQLAPDDFILLAMAQGGILRVMYRFVKNIKGTIAGYLVHDTVTPTAYDWHNYQPATLPYWVKLRQPQQSRAIAQQHRLGLH